MIALAIHNHKYTSKLLLLILISINYGCVSLGSNYTIDHVWMDPNYMYINYREKHSVETYSIFNPHGSVVNEVGSFIISRLPRNILKNGQSFDLKKYNYNGSIIYQDDYFSISNDGNEIQLSGRLLPTSVDKCQASNFLFISGMHVKENIFFCGELYDRAINRILNIPDSAIREVNNELSIVNGKSVVSYSSGKLIYVVSNNKLLISRQSPLQKFFELKFAIFPLGIDANLNWKSITLPSEPGGYRIVNNSGMENDHRFILATESNMDLVLLCNELSCDKVDISSIGYNLATGHLFFDENNKITYNLKLNDRRSSIIYVSMEAY